MSSSGPLRRASNLEPDLKHVVIALIRIYQRAISPWLPASCMYTPSCSHYALEAYQRYGFWRGTKLSVRRLLSCWPWSRGGVDPVPRIAGRRMASDLEVNGSAASLSARANESWRRAGAPGSP